MAIERVWPDVAIPPGDVLAEELEAKGLTQSRLARRPAPGRRKSVSTSSPRFLKRVVTARKALQAGRGVRLEELPR